MAIFKLQVYLAKHSYQETYGVIVPQTININSVIYFYKSLKTITTSSKQGQNFQTYRYT